jgi:hypothetical protein
VAINGPYGFKMTQRVADRLQFRCQLRHNLEQIGGGGPDAAVCRADKTLGRNFCDAVRDPIDHLDDQGAGNERYEGEQRAVKTKGQRQSTDQNRRQ